jgi:DNA polymerase-1
MRFKKSYKVSDEDIAKMHVENMPTEKLQSALNFITDLRDWRKKEKLYNTYFEGAKKALNNTGNKKIFFDYRIEGTVTGRLSCGAYNAQKDGKSFPLGLSFHTLPREREDSIRGVCISPAEHYFITADFKAMELRILAHVAGVKNMIKAFFSGQDLHKYTASLIYEKDIKDVTKEERQIAKSVSFLIVYGGGAWKLSKTANISLAVAEATIERFKQVYPEVFTWMEQVKNQIYDQEYVTSIFGRRRNLPDIKSPIQKIQDKCIRQGVNFIIQSSASDVGCYCLVDVDNELTSRNLDSTIAGIVHDSIEIIAPAYELEETLQIMYNKMVNYPLLKSHGYEFKVPLEVEFKVGSNFNSDNEIKFNNKGTILNRENLYAEKR